tara:strand:+ start:743 stop:1207 length:465 start_codon:yes stop_codon:yes gene_type:complete
MKFKITEISTLKLKVEYEDGSWALIPTFKDGDKGWYATRIKDFCQTPQEPVPVNDIPYKVGDEGTVGDDVPDTSEAPPTFSYDAVREMCYPSLGLQADSLYKERGGDDSQQKLVDAHIAMVKAEIAVDQTKEYTGDEVEAILVKLKADSRWVVE